MSLRQWLRVTSAIIPLSSLMAGKVFAAPQNGTVVGGQATITQQGNRTDVQQTTNRAIVNWQGFSTSANETVTFRQPSNQSVILNRVTGPAPSSLNGQLTSNGQVFLINPNGVVIGPSGSVDVGGFLVTTSAIANQSFMAGQYVFANAPDGSSVVNQGRIKAADGGSVILSAPNVQNSGSIQALLGSVALGAAQGFALDIDGDGLLGYQIGPAAARALVNNSGSISASGGTVQLSARTIDTVNRNVINTTGLIEANSVSIKNGEVVFDGGNQGTVAIGGQVQAAGKNPGETGGSVTASGNQLALAGATIDASGQAGGGTIAVGNWQSAVTSVDAKSRLDASATAAGNGGRISAIGGQSQVAGTLLAKGGPQGGDGGTIETSGHTLSVDGVTVNAGAPKGKAGNWLLDPYDLTVDNAAAATIDTSLATTNVTLQTTGTGTSGPGNANSAGSGDIIIASPISWSSNQSLTLNAWRNVDINAGITASGNTASLVMKTGQGTTGNDITGEGATVTLSGTTPTLQMCTGASCAPVTYTLITSSAGLAAIGSNLSGDYALASPISATTITNPIGYSASSNNSTPSAFGGVLDGLGHSISSLNINNASANNLGLFSELSNAQVKNIGIHNGTITGGAYNTFGLLAGQVNTSTINNSYAIGSVTGTGTSYGGLIGSLGSGTISNSFSTATVSGNNQVGGLAGSNYSGTIIDSFAIGSVHGSGGYVGGLAGYGSATSVFSNDYASGSATGNNRVGGLVGSNGGSITSSYAIGSVSASSTVGGLAGENLGTVTSGYWNKTSSGQANGCSGSANCSGGATLETTANALLTAALGQWSSTTWTAGPAANPYPIFNAPSYQVNVPINNASKTYGAALPSFSNSSMTGFWGTDNSGIVSGLALATNATATSAVGSYSITGSGATAVSATGYPYTFNYIGGTLTINSLQLTPAGFTVSNKTYDGTTAATIATSGSTLTPVLAGDTGNVTISGTAAFTDATAGNGKTVNITGLALGGAAAGNYSLSATSTATTANITKATLTVGGVTVANKTYDATTAAAITGYGTTLGTVVAGDTGNVTVSGSAAFATAAAGSGKTVNITGLALGGSAAGNYSLSTTSSTATADIAAKLLTVSGLTVPGSKTYDGTTTAVVSGTPTLQAAETAGTGSTADGKPYTGDTINVGGSATGTYNSANVASASSVTFGGLTSSNSNYSLSLGSQAATILAKLLTVSGLSVPGNKTYDGTTSAVVSGTPTLQAAETAGTGSTADGKPYTGDTINVGGSATGTYNSATVASAATVTFGGLTSSNSNYSLSLGSQAATILAKLLTVSGLSVPANKTYDGTTTAVVSGTPGLLGSETAGTGSTADGKPYTGDTINVGGSATGTYNSANVASAATVTFGGLTSSNSNYSLSLGSQAATMLAKLLTVSGLSVPASKTYDGTMTAVVSGTPGLQAAETAGTGSTADGKPYTGDTINFVGSATGTYNSANVASASSVTFGGVTSSNSNYSLSLGSYGATITAKSLTVSGLSVPASKTYDGTTTAVVSGTPGLLGSETAGTGSTGDGKPYSGDSITFGGSATGTYNSANVASAANVTFGGVTTSNSNYSLSLGSQAATIAAKLLTVSGLSVPASKIYDGTTTAVVGGTPTLQTAETAGTGSTADGKPYSGDTITFGGSATGTYNSANVASASSVTFGGVTTSNSNYSLSLGSYGATITAKSLTVSGLSVPASKTYDGRRPPWSATRTACWGAKRRGPARPVTASPTVATRSMSAVRPPAPTIRPMWYRRTA